MHFQTPDPTPPREARIPKGLGLPRDGLTWVVALLSLLAMLGVVLISVLRTLRTPTVLTQSAAADLELLLGGAALILGVFAAHRQWQNLRILRAAPPRAKVSEKNPERDRHLLGILRVTRLLGRSANLRETLDGITQTAFEVFEAEQTSVLLLDEKTQELEVCAAAGMLHGGVVGSRQHLGAGIAGQVAASGEPLLLGGVVEHEGAAFHPDAADRVTASMVVPIRLREELIGVLCVGRRSPGRTYDGGDLQMLEIFAEVVAICIRRTQQGAWMQDTIRRLEALVRSGQRAA